MLSQKSSFDTFASAPLHPYSQLPCCLPPPPPTCPLPLLSPAPLHPYSQLPCCLPPPPFIPCLFHPCSQLPCCLPPCPPLSLSFYPPRSCCLPTSAPTLLLPRYAPFCPCPLAAGGPHLSSSYSLPFSPLASIHPTNSKTQSPPRALAPHPLPPPPT